jgi:hypothetical protein
LLLLWCAIVASTRTLPCSVCLCVPQTGGGGPAGGGGGGGDHHPDGLMTAIRERDGRIAALREKLQKVCVIASLCCAVSVVTCDCALASAQAETEAYDLRCLLISDKEEMRMENRKLREQAEREKADLSATLNERVRGVAAFVPCACPCVVPLHH